MKFFRFYAAYFGLFCLISLATLCLSNFLNQTHLLLEAKGILIFVAILILTLPFLFYFGQILSFYLLAASKREKDSGTHQTLDFESNLPVDLVKSSSLAYFQENERCIIDAWKVDFVSGNETLRINTSRTFKFYGNRIELTLSKTLSQKTKLLISSKPETGLSIFDFGRNLLNVRDYQELILRTEERFSEITNKGSV